MTYFVMVLALVLGFTQCKKEQPTSQTEGVHITLNVGGGNNNSKVEVDPNAPEGYATVTFEDDDVIYVGYKGEYVGYLTYSGGTFSGDVEIASEEDPEPLHFYCLGGKGFTPSFSGNTATVVISDQTSKYPVVSYNTSKEDYHGDGAYTSVLKNKISIMKFNVTTPSNAAICIEGMNNQVSVNFGTNAFTYGQVDGGLIKMKGGSGNPAEKWAIVLPNSESTTTTPYTEDGNYVASTSTTIDPIVVNTYYDSGIDVYVNTINPIGPLATPLTFEAKTADATVKLYKKYDSAPDVTLLYSTDGSSWNDYTVGDAIPLTNKGDKVMFRGNNTTLCDQSNNYNMFEFTGEVYGYGNVMSLLDASDFATATTISASCTFSYLFNGCSGLYNHENKPIMLPATTLTDYCYQYMFQGCTNLTTTPELPATTLTQACYQYMFKGCTSLRTAHELRATTLAVGCYMSMFNGCTSLVTAPELSATTLASACCREMFKGCTSLVTTPVLRATKLEANCYNQMFNGCTSLKSIICLATSKTSNSCSNWVTSVASSGTFYKANTNIWSTGISGIPSGWTTKIYSAK